MDATAALRDRINPLLHDISLAAERELPAYSYFMVNVPTVDREPLEQLDLLLAADHLQDIREAQTGYGGTTVAFIADGFRAVGKETPAAAERYLERGPGRAERKQDVLSTAADTLGVHLEDVVTTADVWSDQSYWNRLRDHTVAEEPYPEATADTGAAGDDIGSVHELYDFLRQNTETLLASDLEDTMPLRDLAESRVVDDRFGVDTHLADIAADYRQRTGRTPRAPEVYSLLEIGTAEWLADRYGCTVKIGPAEEEMYDRVIRPALGHDTVQTVQPLDDGRTTVPPYTLHGDTPRPCFGDDTADFATKIRDFDEEFLRVRTNGGKSWHPVVHTAMRLAEARRAMNLPGYTVRAGREDKPAPRYRRDPHPEMVEIVPRNYPGGQRSMELATAGDVEEYLFSDGVTLEDVRDITPALGRPVLDTLDPDDLDGGVPRHSRPAYPEHTSAYQEP